MSAVNTTDPTAKASKKKRRNKKKNDKSKDAAAEVDGNGAKEDAEDDGEGDADDVEEEQAQDASRSGSIAQSAGEAPGARVEPPQIGSTASETLPLRNGVHKAEEETASAAETIKPTPSQEAEESLPLSDTTAKLEAMAQERDALRAEVAELRKSLETIQEKHQEEVSQAQEKLEEAQGAKDSAEEQYRTLLGKVNQIRAQLGERLKADAAELAQARSQIEELQEEGNGLRGTNEELQNALDKMQAEHKAQMEEMEGLRSRTNLSQANWVQERDELIYKEAYAREEFESAKQAMQDWEVLAMEERSLRENLGDRVAELEEQLNAQREAYERAAEERDTQNSTVDGLQRALHEIQDARKRELRELVEQSQAQLESLRAEAEAAKTSAIESAANLESTKKELERALPFEKEVKEKNLLIGKLRHEAVILNDHLTKALRFLKRGKPEDNVDRQIVTNHLLHFITLDRGDPKKFQVLQLIAALLGWTEEQREQAGLARPGASNNALRVPLSPFRRTPSTPSLSSDFMPEGSTTGTSRESLAELWSDFLEREAQEGRDSRSGSTVRTPGFMSPVSEKSSSGLGIKSPPPPPPS